MCIYSPFEELVPRSFSEAGGLGGCLINYDLHYNFYRHPRQQVSSFLCKVRYVLYMMYNISQVCLMGQINAFDFLEYLLLGIKG